MNVQVRVCERGALNNGRFAFTDKFTLVTELLQNARRARASDVLIEFDETAKVLKVVDNGSGIEDFQKLLTFNESGWDESTVDAERPFGVGFSKCLYAATRVMVSSRGKRLEFDCADALEQEVLQVVEDPTASGTLTVVRLEGVNLPRLEDRIKRLVRGFPLPVIFNGTEIPRTHALNALPFVPCDIGHVHLAGRSSGERASGTALYLQGFLIGHRDYYCDSDHLDVIHLDPTRFLARLPDRTELIDAQDQQQVIDKGVRDLWRTVLEQRKVELGPVHFAERFFRIARSMGHVDLFDDMPVLPRQVCSQVAGYPILDQDHRFVDQLVRHVDRAEVERGDVLLAEIDCLDEDDLPRWMYARARGLVIVETAALGELHWLNGHVRNLSLEDFSVVARGETHSVELHRPRRAGQERTWRWVPIYARRSVTFVPCCGSIGRSSADY